MITHYSSMKMNMMKADIIIIRPILLLLLLLLLLLVVVVGLIV